MRTPVQFIRIIGGKDDGLTQRCKAIWWIDPEEVECIKSDGETYRFDRVDGDEAVFVHVPFTPSSGMPSSGMNNL
jgi:hypothetical protein